YNVCKGLRNGFVKSIFGIVQFVLIIYTMKRYYPYFYGYIRNTPILYNSLLSVLKFLMGIIFYRKVKIDPNFLEGIVLEGAFNIFINIIGLVIFYFLIHIILGWIFKLISFIFEAPILKQVNTLAGIVFGLLKGILIIYVLLTLFTSITKIYPEGFISMGLKNSILSNYFAESYIIYNLSKNEIRII